VSASASAEVLVPGGPFTMGTDHDPWALDNERPAHVVDVGPFSIDRFPVTNGEYTSFVADGGYTDPRWWTSAGWEWRGSAGLLRPQFWDGHGGRDRFGVVDALVASEPVQHVCWYEADAYARWVGKRLPTEAEWEKAASWTPDGVKRRWPWGDDPPTPAHANLGQRHFGPTPLGSYPAGASAWGVEQLIGDVWEWTSSDFAPHPGFASFPYREYSEVFFGPEYKVLRGGSWATDPVAMRSTFRNWDFPIRRQIFAGFRCARSVEPSSLAPSWVGPSSSSPSSVEPS
jgi:iron(II)-dependent oxidoreductase